MLFELEICLRCNVIYKILQDRLSLYIITELNTRYRNGPQTCGLDSFELTLDLKRNLPKIFLDFSNVELNGIRGDHFWKNFRETSPGLGTSTWILKLSSSKNETKKKYDYSALSGLTRFYTPHINFNDFNEILPYILIIFITDILNKDRKLKC